MSGFLSTVLSSAAVSAALVTMLLWLFQNLISERLKGTIKFEFDQRLEQIRNAIKFAYDQKLEHLTVELARLSEDRTRKLERLLRHYERQVEEFYGPLWNMVHQLYVCNETKDKLTGRLNSEEASKVEEYYQQNYFRPLHDEIRQIMKTKLYLVDGAAMPESFYVYLRHATQERDQRELASLHHVHTAFLRGVPWPRDFHEDIRNGFDTAMKNYQQCLDGLKAPETTAGAGHPITH
jgi:hypothetical protein